MKTMLKLLLVCGAVFAAAPLAHASSNDNISFTGADNYCNPGASGCTAGQVNFVTPNYLVGQNKGNASVVSANGAFAAFANPASTTFNSFNYLSAVPASGFVLFTSTLSNGSTLTFTIQKMTGTVTGGDLAVLGTGYYTYYNAATKMTTTYPSGSFDLTTQQGGDGSTTVSFSDTNLGVTPEPSSLLLMGTGLSLAAGLLFYRRRMGAPAGMTA